MLEITPARWVMRLGTPNSARAGPPSQLRRAPTITARSSIIIRSNAGGVAALEDLDTKTRPTKVMARVKWATIWPRSILDRAALPSVSLQAKFTLARFWKIIK